MAKTILILIDGLGFKQAEENLGYLEHLIEEGTGIRMQIECGLPSLSRPVYETLMTGLPALQHGIINNLVVRRSKEENIFGLCKKNGFSTAAAAYFWMSELYTRAPFNPMEDRLSLYQIGDITNGMYYFEDFYPDSHVFADAEFLRKSYDPYFMLVHSMNVDEEGHKEGSNARRYHLAAAKANVVLSSFFPIWRKAGYQIVVTSDHGMNEFGLHGGNTAEQRIVPIYIFSDRIGQGKKITHEEPLSQLVVAPLLCSLLEIEPSKEMKKLSEMEVDIFE